jgi:mono/diheme cytochrome c family protein
MSLTGNGIRALRGSTAAMAMGLLLACGSGEERPSAEPRSAPNEMPVATTPTPAAPEPVEAVEPAGPGDAARGESKYAALCASCHGPRGCGGGPLAASLDPTPAKHCDGNYMNGLSDAHLARVIEQGGPAVGKSPLMAPWGGILSDAQIRDVIAYMRSLADPPYTPPSG